MATPKYQIIIETLCAELSTGKFRPGDAFYSEADLKNRFNVSSTTAVKALNILATENKITRIQGKGTFVATEKHNSQVEYTDLNMSQGKTENTKVLTIQLKNDPEILKKLYLPRSATYYEIKRLRYIDKKIIQYTVSYILPEFIDETKLKNPTKFNSIYHRLSKDFDFNPYVLPYHQTTTAKEITNLEILKHFNTKKALPLIIQERQTFLPTQNRVLDYVISYKLLDYWGFEIDSPGQ